MWERRHLPLDNGLGRRPVGGDSGESSRAHLNVLVAVVELDRLWWMFWSRIQMQMLSS